MQSHTNNNMLQIFFIHSIFILLITFLAVFCVDVVFAEEIVNTIPSENLPVPALNSPMELNLFNNNIYVTSNGSNIVIDNATNTSVGEVPFESELNPSDNKKSIMNRGDWNSVPDTRIDSSIDGNSENIADEEGIETIITSTLDENEQVIKNETTTTSDSITFTFSAKLNGEPVSGNVSFICSLDNDSVTFCNSGSITYFDVEIREEPHIFRVSAFTAAGINDTTPATFTWTFEEIDNANDNPSGDDDNPDSSSKSTSAKNLKFCYNSQFGSLGTEDGQFNRPHDIVFDSKGFLYVNDRELNNFQKFSPDGKFISKFGEEGEELGQYKSPYSMAMDSNDNIYVLDRGNDRIVKVDTEGNVLGALYSFNAPWITNDDDDDITEKGDDNGFANPEAMAIDKEGNFYLTDTGNNRVIKFDKNFKFLSQFGNEGSGPGQFDHPHGIGVDSDGNIFINELNNARIQKFTNDGKFIKEWGTEGTRPGQFTLPLEHLKVDKNDRIFITDGADNPRVQVFDNEGNFLTQFGKLGAGDGEFKKPEHVAFDEKGTVYVVDRGNHRIQTFLPCN